MLPAAFVTWCGTIVGRMCVGAAIAALIGGVWFGWLGAHDSKVIAFHEAKIDKATTNATHQLRASGARSTDPSVHGIRDPSTQDE